MRVSETDIEIPGFGEPYRVTRGYANRFSGDEATGGFGTNWYVEEFPYLAVKSDGFGMIKGANDPIWFRDSTEGYRAKFGDNTRLGYDSGANRYIVTMEGGKRFTFAPSPLGPNVWQLEKIRDPGDNSTDFVYLFGLLRSVVRQSTTGSYILLVEYEGSTTRVQRLTLQYIDPADPSNPINLRKVEYNYYAALELDTNSSGIGNEGDLKKVTTFERVGSSWQVTGESHYRYYVPTDSNGFTHGLKYVFGSGATFRAQQQGFDPESNTTTNANLASFADHYFEYNSDHRVTKEVLHGFACGGGNGTYTFASTNNPNNPTGINDWRTKTVETRPDGSTVTVYSNDAGQLLLRDLYDGSQHWIEYKKYWDSGDRRDNLLKEYSSPKNISDTSPYNDSFDNLNVNRLSGAGLVTHYDYETTISSVNVQGYLKKVEVSEGTGGTKIKQRELAYSASPAGSGADNQVFYVSSDKVFRDTGGSQVIETTYSNTYHSGTRQISERTTTLPNVPTSQNGDDSATYYVRERFDTYGYPTWRQDERGVITKLTHNVATGALVERIDDSSTAPSGWSLPVDTELAGPFKKNLVTSYESDLYGRITQELGPTHYVVDGSSTKQVQSGSFMVYKPADWSGGVGAQVWSCQGYKEGSNYKMFDPIQVRIFNFDGKPIDEILSERDPSAAANSRLSASESYTTQSRWKRWNVSEYGSSIGGGLIFGCRLTKRKVYYDIAGALSNDTSFGYDVLGRGNRVKSPGGTIRRTVHDARGLVLSEWVGTNDDGATDSDPTGGGTDPDNNMKKVKAGVFDKNGNGTQETVFVSSSSSDDRVTAYTFDFRNRLTDIEGEENFYQKLILDNLGQVTETQQYDGNTSGSLLGRTETMYDNRGRIYREKRYAVSGGSSGNWLETNRWYDGAGNVLKDHVGGSDSYRRVRQDGLGNSSVEYLCYGSTGLGSPSSDTVVEQTDSAYDEAAQLRSTALRRRAWNGTGLGSLDPAVNTSAPASRIQNQTMWRDGIGRVVAMGNYGTNTPATNWWQSVPPATGSTVLVDKMGYDTASALKEQTDARGKKTEFTYDNAGRRTKVVRNVVTTATKSDENNTVETTYTADDAVKTIKAVNPTGFGGTGDQTTTFHYGSGSSTQLYTADRLNAIEYPESTGSTDRVRFEYNYAGQVTKRTDELQIAHEFKYDKLGRLTEDKATNIPSSVDNTVQRVAWAYDARGLVDTVTNFNAASGGNAVNQVKFTHNGFRQLTKEQQEHAGPVTGSSLDADYTYAAGLASGAGQNTIRRETIIYPNGKTFTYGYGSSGSIDDKLSRIKTISESGTGTLVSYTYNGSAFLVESNRPQSELRYTLLGGAGYHGLDFFDRIVRPRWFDDQPTTSVLVDSLDYGYDAVGSRIWRENLVDSTDSFDWIYRYDGINRLDLSERGKILANHTGIDVLKFAQDWALDSTGNWRTFKQDNTGGGYTLDQTRDSNLDNEIETITGTGGANWAEPAYDAAGNMTTIPKPADPTQTFTAKYDAWNRLVELRDTSSTNLVAQYAYDGLFRRVVKKAYTGGSLSETRHFYYSDAWQVLEERVDGRTNPVERQFLWGTQYIDDLVLRDRDTADDGTLDERLYPTHDANWNIMTLWGKNSGGTAWEIKQRFEYTPYGQDSVLTAAFASATDSYQWERRFASYILDLETNLILSRYRFYHARLGVWLNRDPLEVVLFAIHSYRYVTNSPLTVIDPSGLQDLPMNSIGGPELQFIEGDVFWINYLSGTGKKIDLMRYEPLREQLVESNVTKAAEEELNQALLAQAMAMAVLLSMLHPCPDRQRMGKLGTFTARTRANYGAPTTNSKIETAIRGAVEMYFGVLASKRRESTTLFAIGNTQVTAVAVCGYTRNCCPK